MRDNNSTMQVLRKARHDESGAALLFVMVILVVMVAIGFVLASLVYREVTVARSFDTGLQAYYAAESGIERSLDILQNGRIESGELGGTVGEIEGFADSATPVDLSANTAQWYVDPASTQTSTDELRLSLPQFGGAQVDLYDPDLTITSTMAVESVDLQWNEPAGCGLGRVELTFSEFGGTTFDESVHKLVGDCSAAGADYDCLLRSDHPTAGNNYVVRVRSLDCSILDTSFTAWQLDGGADTSGNSVVQIPSVATITTVGEQANTQRVMEAITKWIPSASGLTDYVLFSETALTK